MSTPATMSLHANLDIGAATPLAEKLATHLSTGVVVDGSAVTHLGGLCLQTLLSAASSFAAADQRFEIVEPSVTLVTALDEFGALPFLRRHLPQEFAA